MKRIVRGNDFTLRVPVMKIVDGAKVAFPLPGCTDIKVNVVNQYRRIALSYTIDVSEDNVLLARVEGDKVAVGTYALEVKGKIFGNDWRSNEYEQFQIVDNNASGDTVFVPQEGEDSVEMDTALVVLAPAVELSDLISDTNEAVKKANDAVSQVNRALEKVQNVDIDIDSTNLNITRPSGEKKEFDLMQLKGDKGERGEQGLTGNDGAKGDKGDAFVYSDFTPEQLKSLTGPKGDKGDIGLTGPQGETGPVGPQGETGPVGPQGETGAQGEQGIQGIKGDPFTYDDFTSDEIENLKKPANDAANELNKYLDIVKLPVVETPASGDTVVMEANKVYVITVGESLTLTLAAPTDTTICNEYQGSFDTGNTAPTVTFPADVILAETPSVVANTHYEFNIRYTGGKYYGLVQTWEIGTERSIYENE